MHAHTTLIFKLLLLDLFFLCECEGGLKMDNTNYSMIPRLLWKMKGSDDWTPLSTRLRVERHVHGSLTFSCQRKIGFGAIWLSLSLKPLCEIRLWECTLPTLFIATSQPKPGTKIPPTSTSKGDTWMLACSNITTRMDWAHRDVHELSLYHLSLSTTFLHPCKPLPSVAHALQLKHLSFGPICAQASWMHAMDTRERRWYHEIINYSKVVQRLWLRGFRDII